MGKISNNRVSGGHVTPAGQHSKAFSHHTKKVQAAAFLALSLVTLSGLVLGGALSPHATSLLSAHTIKALSKAGLAVGTATLVGVAIKNRRLLSSAYHAYGDWKRSKRMKNDENLNACKTRLETYIMAKEGSPEGEDARGFFTLTDASQDIGSKCVDQYFKRHPKLKELPCHDLTFSKIEQSIPQIQPKNEGQEVLLFTVGKTKAHIVGVFVDHSNKRIEFYDSRGLTIHDRANEKVRACRTSLSKFMKKAFEAPGFKEYTLWQNDQKQQVDHHSCGVMVMKWMTERAELQEDGDPASIDLYSENAVQYRTELFESIFPEASN